EAEQQLGSKSGGRRCGLDTEAALPGEPEEALALRIKAIDREPVGREAAQAGPFALDRFDPPVDHLLEAVDGDGDVQLFRGGIAGRARRFLVRAEPKPAVLRLEVEAA